MNNTPSIETQPLEVISRFQFEKVKELLAYLAQRSVFYQRIFSEKQINPSHIRSWKDFSLLPTTSKNDLQQHNWDFLCVEKSKIVEYTSTSGTLGKPVTIALTENDMQRLAYNEAISFACAEGTSSDLYQLMLTLDRQFMAGIAYYYGIRKMGAALVRVGPGLPALQWETIDRLKPTALVAVPSFIVKLIGYAKLHGIDLNKTSVKKAICIGENLRTPDFHFNAVSKMIKNAWDIKLYNTYASTEMQTAFTECKEGRGGHLRPELLVVEILDENGCPVPAGEAGEVTITTLGVEGMPLLRYRTGDLCHIHYDACACGRNTARLGPVVGRKQQMIKFKGTTLYPPVIFDVLHQIDLVRDYVVEAFTGTLETDELKLYINLGADGERQLAENVLKAAFQARLRVIPDITFVSQKEIEMLQQAGAHRKIRRFIDNR